MIEPRLLDRYFGAWNAHDPDGVRDCFDDGGCYTDPASGPLTGDAIGAYADELFTAFPDLAFEVDCRVPPGDGDRSRPATARWLMTGTCRAPYRGLPPTGRTVRLPGVDLIAAGPGGLASVDGYFDQLTFLGQVGAQVSVQPPNAGPVAFGVATRVRGEDPSPPGALSLTWVDVRSDEEVQEVRDRSLTIVGHLRGCPGFLGWVGLTVDQRMYTLTAWRDPAALRALRTDPQHQDAVRHFFGSDFATALQTTVWAPHQLNPLRLRCRDCDTLIDGDVVDACSCGARPPDRPVFL